MCGFAGLFHYREPERQIDRALLLRMTQALEHRGPDDSGCFTSGPIGLGHRRLSIVDLSPTGHQPMSTPDATGWIAYNGEFYNHEEFRPRLRETGCNFRGTSDTETLLYLVHSKGADVLDQVAGIFAFAYWDERQHELTLARDPLGVKQLYFHDNGQRIAFASEIKALLELPDVPRSPDLTAVNQYLHFHTPLFERTFFQGIRQLLPGQILTVSERGIRARTYWSVDDFEPRDGSPEEQAEELREQLSVIVKQQLLSDVPVGAFFSGGIDSTTVAAYAARAGRAPHLFGIHFSHQGVVDERPFQEAAARALGLELDLATLDGSSLPDDLFRLIRSQDQPVIGAAMIPMYHVSKLASRRVKVCLGGQAADEIFGGYARYALTRPFAVMNSWFSGRRSVAAPAGSRTRSSVGGNLWKQLSDPRTLKRLARSAAGFGSWRSRYFNNFARVPEGTWRELLPDAGVSRSGCWDQFNEELDRGGVEDPATAAMYWDLRTYLPGLFQQDDRMSMANSLESRVPLADPRLVRFAFKTGFDLKVRGGASKWILRQAVSDVIPPEVLNRRKVGFDTPAELWMRDRHPAFVRDLLLSREARSRGLWDPKAVERMLDHHSDPHWFDLVWKSVCIEVWARTFIDGGSSAGSWTGPPETPATPEPATAGDWLQEVREMGVDQVLFRAGWEFKQRSGLSKLLSRPPSDPPDPMLHEAAGAISSVVPFAAPLRVAERIRPILKEETLDALRRAAQEAARGRILCFGRWVGDFGDPIDWHRDPVSGRRWNAEAHWSKALGLGDLRDDVKFVWEAGRFPQAYLFARAASFFPELAPAMREAFESQVRSFIEQNPFGLGVHWTSGQEIVFRLMAWLFGLGALGSLGAPLYALKELLVRRLHEAACHLENNLDYARRSVYNNHLLSEALGLYLISALLPSHERAGRWRKTGLGLLEEQVDAQIYPDGAYLQNSHNYHRVALQDLLWAWVWRKRQGEIPPESWSNAMERSLDLLVAHQNPGDGRLPNYGPNDGSLPAVLSSCDFADFRPALQAVSVAVRGERVYETGPWDEEAAWLFGPEVLDLPLRNPSRRTVSFGSSGYHVLRGREAENFAAFRCGSLRNRFSQIDMLHVDVWWKGQNVLADGGSYRYNGAPEWHEHFHRTASHNTITVDGRDQMRHVRQFKSIYWTQARISKVEDAGDWVVAEGEHYGYRRHPGGVVHRRQVLFVKDDLWVIADHITGEGDHALRLHWLGGEFPFSHDGVEARMSLSTPRGSFAIAVHEVEGALFKGTVVAGRERPPRGWISRYYGEKVPAPSLMVDVRRRLPLVFVSILAAGSPQVRVDGNRWSLLREESRIQFELNAGTIDRVALESP
jgi:asparagine synthase (glutamine-hydrolysing)